MFIIKSNWFLKLIKVQAIMLWPFIFVKSDLAQNRILINHERIHVAQAKEMLVIFFYVWYIIEWFVRFLRYWNFQKAYLDISFEREAYRNQNNLRYLENRQFWTWLKYLL